LKDQKKLIMKKLATVAVLIGILGFRSSASSKPCPAYAKAPAAQKAIS